MPGSYIDLRLRAGIDSGELAAELAATGLLGTSEDAGVIHLYWPVESWNQDILESIRRFLEEKNLPFDAATAVPETLPDQDWNSLWTQSIGPIRIGRRFLIRQSWNPVDACSDEIQLVIDPKRAFGTGFHATSQLILEWLEGAVRGNERVLDVGTGSGLLAMGALRLGAAFALGIDCDPEAIECALENAAVNRFGKELEFRLGSIERLEPRGFDVAVANLDRNTLLRFTREVAQAVIPRGTLCVSGILVEDFEDISRAFAGQGGQVTGKWQRDDWLALEIRFGACPGPLSRQSCG